jgi:hypothetical protein
VRRILCLVVPLALALVACGGADEPVAVDPTDEPTESTTVEPEATATAEPTPTPTPDGPVAPLTGLPVEDEEVLERFVLAVKVDNLAPARPQSGLNGADVVFVELVESATRLLALFHSTDPGEVGPVRSGRMVDADLLPPLGPLFTISGADTPVWPVLREALPMVREEGQGGGWRRDRSRRAPYNLYLSPAAQWESAAGELDPAERHWEFAAEPPGGGARADRLDLRYPTSWGSAWHWDGGASAWLRDEQGAPHVDIEGERLSATNVVVAHVERTGSTTRPFEPIGEGDAVVFRDGQAFEARWRKEGRDEQFEWLTADGEPFPLAPGRTWVELLPGGGTLDYGRAGAG